MDPQIEGFNSTNVTSGPIILADKSTLFIPDFRYLGKDNNIEFHALTEDSPYSNSTTKVPSEYSPQGKRLIFNQVCFMLSTTHYGDNTSTAIRVFI